MTENVRFERSSGNVFKDIGFPEAEAERELLKADLAVEIYRILKGPETDTGEGRGTPRRGSADVSRLIHGDFDRFSVERLFAFLNRLNRNVEIRITPAENAKGHQRVVAV